MNHDAASVSEPKTSPRPAIRVFRFRLSQAALCVSALLWLGLTLCYWLRPDTCAAFTIFPVWCWAILGCLMTGMGWLRQLRREVGGVAGLWLIFLLLFADEPRSLLRSLRPLPGGPPTRTFRVVSLNCNAGDPLAAAEVATQNPDVVLLQESPSRTDVEKLTHKLFGKEGGFMWGVDGSIVARGELTPRPLSPAERNYFVEAQVQTPDGHEVEVVSLRLMTPPFRIDLWSAAGREAYRVNRQVQKEQMKAIANRLSSMSGDRAVVVGGDFNAPQSDAIFEALRPQLRDSFSVAGRGWGDTITEEFPALRIDQIWVSARLQPRSVVAIKTVNSDHRIVVADFRWWID